MIRRDAIENIMEYIDDEIARMMAVEYDKVLKLLKTHKGLLESITQKLLEKEILIRDCSDYENFGSGYYRIAVKTHRENKKILSSIRKVMGA